MKINVSTILFLIVFVLVNHLLVASGTKVLKPKNNSKKIGVIVSRKERAYYQLSVKESSVLIVRGPGKLKIITRTKFDNNSLQNYSVYYKVDGDGKVKKYFKNVSKSSNASFSEKQLGIPGDGKEIVINLGRGEHTIELWNSDEKKIVCCRYLLTKVKEKKIDWVTLSPLYPNEPVNLVTNENVVSYFRFSDDKPLKIKITGPTELKILSRIENHFSMKGRINYRLQVKEDEKLKNTFLLNSVRSDVSLYKKSCGKIPGKAKEIVIEVPKGTHTYYITPLDKDKNTILARILFPKKDVKLEE
jgi:hypothetical protein